MNILVICISVVICYGMYLFYTWNPYVDEIVESTPIKDHRYETVGEALLVKRIYKNGRTIYVNKRYK